MEKIFDLGFGLVVVAGLTTIVAHKNSARIVTAITNGFANSIKAATGQ